VDLRTPIIWDFDNITSLTAYPIDPKTLTVSGGRFTTVVNQGQTPYATRNILVERSNVVIDGVSHDLEKEADSTAVYFNGFIEIENCADVTVKNATVAGHKPIDGYDGYEFLFQHSLNVTVQDCRQSNDICDETLRGITGTNTCKNMVFDGVELNRVDSHKFVTGLIIKNSVIGWHGITVTGQGTLLVENTKICSGAQMINLRDDFGSVWDGEFIIRSCEYVPLRSPILIRGIPHREFDFGHPCAMPGKITIDGLVVDESRLPFFHMGLRIFGGFIDFNSLFAAPKYPYDVTKEIAVRGLTVRNWVLSHNVFMFRRWVLPTTKITELGQ